MGEVDKKGRISRGGGKMGFLMSSWLVGGMLAAVDMGGMAVA